MNAAEYKQLSYKLVTELQTRLDKDHDGVKAIILQDSLQFNNQLIIGIEQFVGSPSKEVYILTNDGNQASYRFAGFSG